MSIKLVREARRLLSASGLPFELVEATGRMPHHEVYIHGMRVLVLSKGVAKGRDLKKLESAIRRATC